jgi:outer membrane biosynthesis protein TonB
LIITAAYFAYRWRSEQTPAAQVLVAEPTPPITNQSAEPIPPPKPPQVQELPAAAPDLQPKPASPVRAASKKPRKTPPVTVPAPVSAQPPSTPAPAVSEPAESAPQAAAAPKPAEKTPESAPTRGVITWSGRMGKNTILILNEGGASFGQASGTLPGVPVTVEVEPKSIQIQSRPSPANGWKLLMLRSGKQAVESITIRWHADR